MNLCLSEYYDIGILEVEMARVLRIKDVAKKVGMSVSSVRNRLDPKSPYYDESFPKPFYLGLKGKGAMGWDEDAIDAWITSQMLSSSGAVSSMNSH